MGKQPPTLVKVLQPHCNACKICQPSEIYPVTTLNVKTQLLSLLNKMYMLLFRISVYADLNWNFSCKKVHRTYMQLQTVRGASY